MADPPTQQASIGLAVSGGGFRATLFHIGSFWRLNELGWLSKLTRVTSVSGGSITSGVLAQRWSALNFDSESGVADNFEELVARPLQCFCTRLVDIPAILKGLVWPFMSAGAFVAREYDKHLFHGDTLQKLPAKPRFIIYGTSYQTGVSVRLTRRFLSDYKIGRLPSPDLSLAKAVAVSSAFPPFLAPILIRTNPGDWQAPLGKPLDDQDAYRRQMYLADGGVYDNMGLEAIWNKCGTVLVSDAGSPLANKPNPWLLRLSNILGAMRVLGILTEQTRALRKRTLIEDFKSTDSESHRDGTYWGITTHICDYRKGEPDLPLMVEDNALTGSLKNMRTRLNPFSPEEQGHLINWGYALTDAGMRRHVIPGTKCPPATWPIEDYPLDTS